MQIIAATFIFTLPSLKYVKAARSPMGGTIVARVVPLAICCVIPKRKTKAGTIMTPPSPSDDDIRITKRLFDAGKILGIELLDHVLVGADSIYSMKEHGRFKEL